MSHHCHKNHQVSLQRHKKNNDIVIKIILKLLRQGRKQITELALVTNCILKYANHRSQDNTCSVYASCYKAMIGAVLKYMPKTESSIVIIYLKIRNGQFSTSHDCKGKCQALKEGILCT